MELNSKLIHFMDPKIYKLSLHICLIKFIDSNLKIWDLNLQIIYNKVKVKEEIIMLKYKLSFLQIWTERVLIFLNNFKIYDLNI